MCARSSRSRTRWPTDLQDRAPHHAFPGAEKSYSQADLNDKLKRGFYLATIGHCMECHTPFNAGGGPRDFAGSLGKGGAEFPGPWGVVKSRNITSSKTAGIGDWTDAEIKRRSFTASARTAASSIGPMGFQYYVKMTDADLDAVVAYLRTVPAKDSLVGAAGLRASGAGDGGSSPFNC